MSGVVQTIHPTVPKQQLYATAAQASACVRQARLYTKNTAQVDVFTQPLLAYYALLNWYKSLLYLFDLTYPSSTSVLQHGISIRRSKRSAYQLPAESVYFYKEGVLQSAAGLSGVSLPRRVMLGDALGLLSSLHNLTATIYPSYQHLFPVMQAQEDGLVFVDRRAPSRRGLTVHEWLRGFNNAFPSSTKQAPGVIEDFPVVDVQSPPGWLRLPRFHVDHPWVVRRSNQLWIADDLPLPEWVLHFITLYCLSSIVRYNPLEWSDISRWHNETDALFVEAYLAQSVDFIDSAVQSLFAGLFDHHLRGLRSTDA